jgi:hypothetical protein
MDLVWKWMHVSWMDLPWIYPFISYEHSIYLPQLQVLLLLIINSLVKSTQPTHVRSNPPGSQPNRDFGGLAGSPHPPHPLLEFFSHGIITRLAKRGLGGSSREGVPFPSLFGSFFLSTSLFSYDVVYPVWFYRLIKLGKSWKIKKNRKNDTIIKA